MKIKAITAAVALLGVQAAAPLSAAQPSFSNFGIGDGGWAQIAQDYLNNSNPLGNDSRVPVAPDPTPVVVQDPLSPAVENTLLFMREEEKMARDVYLVLFDQWGTPVFENIALRSEQKHMDMMKEMLNKYGIADPITDDTVGVFVNSDLDSLYQDLVARGMTSLEDALMVGALIEEVDILDLMRAIDEAAAYPDLVQAYENLMLGSRNHLRAFVGQLESLGIVYQAQLMDPELVDEILDSPMERGNDTGSGQWGGTPGGHGNDPAGSLTGTRNPAPPATPPSGGTGFGGLPGGNTSGNTDDPGKLCVGIECFF